MAPTEAQIAAICAIGHENSLRGSGRSLRDLLAATGYRALRPELTPAALAACITAHPPLLEQWQLYSLDKRTRGGWALGLDATGGTVGRIGSGDVGYVSERFASAPLAAAEYILRELDFWAAVEDTAAS